MQCHIEQADVDVPPTIFSASNQRGQTAHAGNRAGHKVDHGEAKTCWR